MSATKSAWLTTCLINSGTHWGEVKTWLSVKGTTVKMITMKAQTRNSFKFNKLKDEMLICVSGRVKATYGDQLLLLKHEGDLTTSYLEPGMALAVQSECPYRLEADDDSVIIEVSSGQEGIVRLADDYGRETEELSEHMTLLIERVWG